MRTTFAELIQRGALIVNDGYRTKRAELAPSGIPILRVAEIGDGILVPRSDDRIKEEYRSSIGVKLSKPGDVLLTTKGTVGRRAVVPELSDEFAYSPQVCFFRVLDSSIDRRWLYYWLGGAEFWNQALGISTQTDMAPYISLRDLRSIQIDLPPLSEQRAIAATLGALDDKIESNRRVGMIAEQLGDALFAAAASESRLLSEVADITMGSSPKGADLNEDGEGLPFYQGARDFGVRFPSLRVWTTAPVRTASKGDTLMSVRAPVGELNRASADCCIGRGVAAFHSDTHYSTLYYAMRCSSSAWDKFQGEGTVFASVNKTDVHGAEIRWVGDGAILELENKLRAIDARIESLESETQSLITLRDALLPELLSGRIRVPVKGVAA